MSIQISEISELPEMLGMLGKGEGRLRGSSKWSGNVRSRGFGVHQRWRMCTTGTPPRFKKNVFLVFIDKCEVSTFTGNSFILLWNENRYVLL